ncbi:MAG TPA: MdtA/MuxA family multidrug efflux RND transporter periplasmic adaptor subunit [Dongiaceae bacterium]|nr:MdtA/MuxA family multidrug efflux RND transporter periplasmic adaptor subunit [Dongiaceae bacterium]
MSPDRAPSQPAQRAPAPDSPTRPPPDRKSAGPRRRWGWRILWLAVCLAALIELALWVGGRRVEPVPPSGRAAEAAPTVQVGVATVTKGDIPVTLDALGTVTPLATVTVKSQISGQITRIAFQEGQTVKKGDLLAVIDTRPYTIALEQAEATLARDQALLRNAENDLARYQKLVTQDSIARQTVDNQRYLVSQYQATVQSDKVAIDNAKLNLDYCHITAPVGGRVGLRQVDEGNYVQVGGTTGIVVITQMQPITVVFTLPEDDLPRIMQRLSAGAVLPVTAYDRSMTTKIAEGRLATVDNQIDTTTGTVKLKAEFDNEDQTLFPNQFVNARLLVDTLAGVAVVPRAAVLHGAPGDYVYVVGPDDTVSIRKVETGPAEGERIAIRAGLEPGERVVVDGTDRLRDGARVHIAGAGQRTTGAPGGQPPKPAQP